MVEAEILKINKQAMEQLRDGQTNQALSLLNLAQSLLSNINSNSIAWGLTFNNLGCYFKKIKKFDLALKNYFKALEIALKRPSDILNLSGIYLNMSSTYSENLKHEKALVFAYKAYNLLIAAPEKDQNVWTSIIITHHCIGQEYEYINKNNKAFNMYRKGWELSIDHLGKTHKLTASLKKMLEKCQALKSSSTIPVKSKNPSPIRTRSHSSNLNSRIRLPEMPHRIITPTKQIYKIKNKNDKIPMKILAMPAKQMNILNDLVEEVEKTIENKPKKYVFTKIYDVDIANNMQDKDQRKINSPKNLSIVRKNTTGHTNTPSPNSHLQIIPEARNEDFASNSSRNPQIVRKITK
ncbi:hypothetical protein SteCoe_25376 [Stentor coeruleus]|uniref:MalT-like TPR region domain-containing protein n=1 Tax=Stentor coeruleus TaxID=5963 RepID=A0A1R2BFA1_9CILI|nr:hypothetical protein SteCoe_25376 [Stentor coeruleus]